MIEVEERERRAKKLAQIKALLDKADSTGFTAEADAARQKADDLMLAYAISEAEINAARKPEERQKPEMRHIKVCDGGIEIKDELIILFHDLARHARCKAVFTGMGDKRFSSTATIVGFPADIDYVDMLFTSLRLQMATNLEPRPDPDLSFEENVALLKEAGMKWQRVYELLFPEDFATEPVVPKSVGVRFTKTYTDYCERTGRPRLRTSPKVYVKNYADGYVSKVGDRLRQIRLHQKETHVGGTGTDIMLRDRNQEVNDLYQELFPKTGTGKLSRSKFDHAAHASGQSAGARADLGQTRVGGKKGLNA
jgi:hypothetical protein